MHIIINLKIDFLLFAAARKLTEFGCSKFYESGTLFWVGQIYFIV